jgi:hypothetical protein
MQLEEKDLDLSEAGTAFPAKEWMLVKWQNYVELQHSVNAQA